ncbi:MAG TPA: hypothetical protein VLH35_04795 [Candidatus Acidoferrales bacterium]|nr:hypothetical protein [Candidatus Acidoferrales bacterium]
MPPQQKRSNTALKLAGAFLAVGVLTLAYAMLFEMQIAAFIGLGLTFWGVVLALTRNGHYIDSTLLDATARSTYSTIDRMFNDLKYNGQGYYLPAYPKDVTLPDYLKNLREPVVYISESFDGKPSIDELASGKFLSTQSHGFFISSPGGGILMQVEKQLQLDLSKVNLSELCELLPKCLTENLNLARNAEMTLTPNGANFKAVGIIYDSLHNEESKPRSVNLLGCPVVSAVASALAKSSTKTVILKEQLMLPGNSVNVTFNFV